MPLPVALRAEFASLEKSFLSFAGFYGNAQGYALQNPDPTLISRGRGKGLGLYERVEEDCHASAVIQQRKYELISREWRVEPASEDAPDIKAADMVRAQLEALGVRDYPLARDYGVQGFDGVALNFLDAIFKGYAVGETMWGMDGSEVFAAEVRHKDQRRFGWVQSEGGWDLRLLTNANWLQGEPIPDRKIIYHSPNATDINPYGLGLDSKIFWPVFFKRQDISFWLIFADKFGSPTPVGKYQAGATETDKATLLAAMNAIAQGMAATIPEGMLIEFLEASRSGTINTYEAVCRYMDEQISECVLGQTGTTNQSSGGGSRARDEVARTGMTALIRADGDLLARTLERTLIRWIVELNRPVLGEMAKAPRLRWVFEDQEDLNQRAERDEKLFSMGYKLTPEMIQEVYGEGYELAVAAEEMDGDVEIDPSVVAAGDVQQTALNGAQIKSLVEVVQAVSDKTMPIESGIRILQIAFPAIDEATARAVLTPVQNFESANLSDALPSASDLSPPAPLPGGEGSEDEPEAIEMAEGAGALPGGTYPRRLAARVGAEAGPVIDEWVGQIRELLEGSDDLASFSEGLATLYPALEKERFADAVELGLMAAYMGGAAEVQAEAEAEADDSNS